MRKRAESLVFWLAQEFFLSLADLFLTFGQTYPIKACKLRPARAQLYKFELANSI